MELLLLRLMEPHRHSRLAWACAPQSPGLIRIVVYPSRIEETILLIQTRKGLIPELLTSMEKCDACVSIHCCLNTFTPKLLIWLLAV